MSVSLINGDADLDHLIQIVSPGFLHYKVTSVPFVINKYPGGKGVEIL